MRRLSSKQKARQKRIQRKRERRRSQTRRRPPRAVLSDPDFVEIREHYMAAVEPEMWVPPTRIPLIMPRVLSLEANYSETVSVVNDLRDLVLKRGQRVVLMFHRVEEVEPAASLLLT